MTSKINGEFAEVLKTPKYLPSISLIMPFETKMGVKAEIAYKLKMAADKIENELKLNYPEEKAKPVIRKLRNLIDTLKYEKNKKSIVIFVSPLLEKVFFLDRPLEEKMIIDDSFEIRDLVLNSKENHKYVLAILSSKEVKVFLGNHGEFKLLPLNVPVTIDAYKNDIGEKTANFSDEKKRKEMLLDKFMQSIDKGLTVLLQEYDLPLFVMGTDKTIGHFMKRSHIAKHVTACIPGNYEDHTIPQLKERMELYVKEITRIKQRDLLKQVDAAMSSKKLAFGIKDVWKVAMEKKGRTLLVEKNFVYPAQHGSHPDVIYTYDPSLNSAFYIKDAVDDIIEKVVENGGDVEFLDEGALEDYGRIVLIEYYE